MPVQIGDNFPDKGAFMFTMKEIAIKEGYQFTVPYSAVYPHEYEVRTPGGESFPVYLNSRSCPCRRWTYTGVPCAHAVAAISFAGGDYVDFVDDYLKVDAFERTCARGIHAMSTVIVTEDDDLPHVGPPNTRRPPGRPHKKRVRTEDVGIAKKRVKVTCGLMPQATWA
ncbi:hypothetical protein LIPSTDRAFT_232391 [Lipomyces starkeyi NRRL Y-11557]|uniref:SWIM-type domain-containing protein n=1 Tax=Lipomyces starkeyi NRRL Y-11557 TaxID=675824 RepID=A0A1E3QBK1_LIPST|nr:hypothetical protein LIPSTDRAFT_232391 [Lipomyces starkeyi NRRL Y-11557]